MFAPFQPGHRIPPLAECGWCHFLNPVGSFKVLVQPSLDCEGRYTLDEVISG